MSGSPATAIPSAPGPSPSATAAPAPPADGSDWAGDPRFDTVIHRRPTRSVRVGDVWVGSAHPVVVQSMINEDTLDVEGATAGIRRLHDVGCEIVRLTVPSLAHARAVGEIRRRLEDAGVRVPLVADVHHNGMKIALEVAQHVDKVRINPGLYVFDKPDPNRTEFTPEEVEAIAERIQSTLEPLVSLLKEQDKALRIGVNHGSLAERMLFTYGDTPLGMVESALEFIRICDRLDFHNIVVSMKASRAPVMLAAYRLMAHRMDAEGFPYPLHLGVTEAGDGDYGRIKSTAGIATLLAEGLGDTIRVSLTGGSGEGDPCLLLDPAGPGPAQDDGGIRGLSQLRPHPLQPGGGAAHGAGCHGPPHRPGHRRDGLHRQRSRRDGRCRLRLRGQDPRHHLPLPGTGGDPPGSRSRGGGGADRPDQGGRPLGRPLSEEPSLSIDATLE